MRQATRSNAWTHCGELRVSVCVEAFEADRFDAAIEATRTPESSMPLQRKPSPAIARLSRLVSIRHPTILVAYEALPSQIPKNSRC